MVKFQKSRTTKLKLYFTMMTIPLYYIFLQFSEHNFVSPVEKFKWRVVSHCVVGGQINSILKKYLFNKHLKHIIERRLDGNLITKFCTTQKISVHIKYKLALFTVRPRKL